MLPEFALYMVKAQVLWSMLFQPQCVSHLIRAFIACVISVVGLAFGMVEIVQSSS